MNAGGGVGWGKRGAQGWGLPNLGPGPQVSGLGEPQVTDSLTAGPKYFVMEIGLTNVNSYKETLACAWR